MKKEEKGILCALRSDADLQKILQQNERTFVERPLCDALSALLAKSGLSRAQVIERSLFSTVYGYQIFAGQRRPTRDKLLMLCFGMGLSYDEVCALLKEQGYASLYEHNKRDALIVYALLHCLSLLDLNNLLFENKLKTLE